MSTLLSAWHSLMPLPLTVPALKNNCPPSPQCLRATGQSSVPGIKKSCFVHSADLKCSHRGQSSEDKLNTWPVKTVERQMQMPLSDGRAPPRQSRKESFYDALSSAEAFFQVQSGDPQLELPLVPQVRIQEEKNSVLRS